MGSSGASVAFHTYNALIRSASMHASAPYSGAAANSASGNVPATFSNEKKSVVNSELLFGKFIF